MGSNKGQLNCSCDYCGKQQNRLTCENWEMNHLHFDDADIDFLTCEKCKLLDPWIFVDKLEKQREQMN